MDAQNRVNIQARWSVRRNGYLRSLINDLADNILVSQMTCTSPLKKKLSEESVDNGKNKFDDELNIGKFQIRRSHTAYGLKTNNNCKIIKTEINLLNEKRKSCGESLFNNLKRSNTTLTQLNLNRMISGETNYSSRSLLTQRSERQNELIRINTMSSNNYSEILERRPKLRGKSVYIDTERNEKFSPDQVAQLVVKFKKAVKKVFAALIVIKLFKEKYNKNCYQVKSMFKLVSETSDDSIDSKDLVFDKSQFKKSKENPLHENIKNILRMSVDERNENRVRTALTAIIQVVPEFEEFPQHIQGSFIKYGFYEEFEPGRILIKEGHFASFYYFVVSGNAMVSIVSEDEITGEIKNRPISFLKRGNTFGENALISNSKRTSTIVSNGKHMLGLISIYKDEFYRFYSPNHNLQDRKLFLNSNVPIFNMINYPVHILNTLPEKSCNTVYYRKGMTISDNSVLDEWLYIIKSGCCRVMKSVLVNNNARKQYFFSKHRREHDLFKVIQLNENSNEDKMSRRYYSCMKKNGISFDDVRIKLEVEILKEGDIFGIRDLIFNDNFEMVNPMTLVSDGAECILIERKQFLKYLNEIGMSLLKISIMPYPSDEYFLRNYFDKEDWQNYRKNNFASTVRKLNLNK